MTKIAKDPRQVVILDKSFAQGARYGTLQQLADAFIIVVTSSFYFETFTTLSESRKRIFAGFPEFRRVDMSLLHRLEKKTQSPAASLESVRLNVNPEIISGIRVLSADELKCMEKYENYVVKPMVEFWKNVMKHGVIGFDVSEVNSVIGDLTGFKSLCERIKDVDFIRHIAAELCIPNANILDENWVTFRYLQVKLLHGLTLQYMYPIGNSQRSDRDLEHDVHDIDYLALGLHARCFATNESSNDFRKLGWKFKFLLPEGILLQTEGGSAQGYKAIN